MSWNDFLPELALKHEVLEILYADIGTPDDAKAKECQSLFDKFLVVINEHIRHVEEEKTRLVSQCEQMLQDIRRMTRLVGQGEEGIIKLIETLEGMTLWERHSLLHDEYTFILEHYTQKLEEIRTLHRELSEYAAILGPSYVQPGPYPEEGAAVTFEVKRRVSVVESAIIGIRHLWNELGLSAQDAFDREIIEAEQNSYPVSDEAIRRLEMRQSMLEDERSKREALVKEHMVDITRLWDKLRIDEDEREEFVTSHVGLTMDTIRAYKAELDKLEDVKSEKIQEFIEDERDALYDLWDKLYYSLEQREKFAPFFDDSFTDENLAAHEIEVARLKQEVEENAHILSAIEQYRKMLDDIREFEISSMDAQRLFHRDPGRLLREEKFRKRMAREFPKVETELEDALYEWQQTKGRPFLVYGEQYINTMKLHAQQAREGKENEKLWREQRRELSLQRDLRYGSRNPKKTPQSPHPRRISPAELATVESSGRRTSPPAGSSTPQPQTPSSKRTGLAGSRPGTPSSQHVRSIPSFLPTTPTRAKSQTLAGSGHSTHLQSPRSHQLQRQNGFGNKLYSRSESPATSFSLTKLPSTPSAKQNGVRSSGPPVMMTTVDQSRRSNSIISISSATTDVFAEPSTPTRSSRMNRPISFDLTRQSIREEDGGGSLATPRGRKRTAADMSSPSDTPPGSPSAHNLRRKSRSLSPRSGIPSIIRRAVHPSHSPFISKTVDRVASMELVAKEAEHGNRFMRQLLKSSSQQMGTDSIIDDDDMDDIEQGEEEEEDSIVELDQSEAARLFSTSRKVIEVDDDQEYESEGWETENDDSPRSRRQSKSRKQDAPSFSKIHSVEGQGAEN
ncbi:hypothetical protein EDD11_007744 [Mortierella claussenii]|nr:hypothetical protein EDD11_007744 [Mortierella claussenii]